MNGTLRDPKIGLIAGRTENVLTFRIPALMNVWVLIASRKGGHYYPALALHRYLSKRGYNSHLINFLDESWIFALADSVGRWGDLNLKPLYRFGYRNLQKNSTGFKGLYRVFEGLMLRVQNPLPKMVEKYGKPDVVLSIQPEMNVIAHAFKKVADRFFTAIIDLLPHGLWVSPSVDMYFAPNEEVSESLPRYGVRRERVALTGLPIREEFSKVVKRKKEEVRRELGLPKEGTTVLIMAGLLGKMIDFEKVLREIRELNLFAVVIFGKNERLVERYANLPNVKALGVVENVYDYMWASDILISKPGSVTIAEITALGKPSVLITPRAGSLQEHRFANLVQRKGAGVWVKDEGDVVRGIKEVMERYGDMSRKSFEMGKHHLKALQNIERRLKWQEE